MKRPSSSRSGALARLEREEERPDEREEEEREEDDDEAEPDRFLLLEVMIILLSKRGHKKFSCVIGHTMNAQKNLRFLAMFYFFENAIILRNHSGKVSFDGDTTHIMK